MTTPFCDLCTGDANQITSEGVFVNCGYDSNHDTTTFVWTVRENPAPEAIFDLCDKCLDRLVEEGKLEAVWSQNGKTGLHLSPRAYAALFTHGAQKVRAAFMREHGPREILLRPLGPEARAAMDRLRAEVTGDETVPGYASMSMPRKPQGASAVEIGRVHALVAIALGCSEEEPGFEVTARDWGEKRAELDAEIDRSWEEFRADFFGSSATSP